MPDPLPRVQPEVKTPDDHWSRWLKHTRHGGDVNQAARLQPQLNRIRDRVLAGAALAPDLTLVDVGAGDGLVALEALRLFAGRLKVIFTDVSVPLLEAAEAEAGRLGFRASCQFLPTPAETLAGIADAGADAVTSRAAFAYVQDKPAAARQFFRVLKPGGRLSLGEPILQDAAIRLAALTRALQVQPSGPATNFARLLQRCRAAQLPATAADIQRHPLTGFSDRDLVALFQQAGFAEIHLELHLDLKRGPALPWQTFIAQSPYPGAPSLGEVMAAELTTEEQRLFEETLRPQIETGRHTERETVAYLTAIKPPTGGASPAPGSTLDGVLDH